MKVRHFETGEEVDPISTAGEPFDQYEQDGIRAGVFTTPDAYYIPTLESAAPGSGRLGAFLQTLREMLTDRPIRFVNVINERLRVRLVREGFEIVDSEAITVSSDGRLADGTLYDYKTDQRKGTAIVVRHKHPTGRLAAIRAVTAFGVLSAASDTFAPTVIDMRPYRDNSASAPGARTSTSNRGGKQSPPPRHAGARETARRLRQQQKRRG